MRRANLLSVVAVLHLLPSAQRRGAESFALELHNAMLSRALDSAALALIPAPPGAPELPVEVLGANRFSVASTRRLRARAQHADVVIAHGSSTLLACGVGLAGAGTPFVYVNIGDPRFWAPSGARKLRVRLLLERAAAVSAICGPARDTLIDHFGLDPAKIAVIPNGRSGERFTPADAVARKQARADLGLPIDGRLVACIGALSPEKRVDVAVRAIAQMEDVSLVLAGEGPERDRLEVLATAAPGRVHFLGATDRPEAVLAAADAIVLTSDSEGVPGVLIEAGFAGLPAVATDVGWVPEVVDDGRTGRLVPPDDPKAVTVALMDVLGRREELGTHARSHCLARFELGHVADVWESLVANVARVPVADLRKAARSRGEAP